MSKRAARRCLAGEVGGPATAASRAVFARSPLERKPMYIDFESPALRRVLARFVAPARDRTPRAPFEFAEMLPAPGECWLETEDGRHTSELRLAAVDRTRSPG
jgi:hypothetical protein